MIGAGGGRGGGAVSGSGRVLGRATVVAKGLTAFHLRWYGRGSFEYEGPWWETGFEPGENGRRTFVAAVMAFDAEAAKEVIVRAHDQPAEWGGEWSWARVLDGEPFSDRFPRAGWMRWPWPLGAPALEVRPTPDFVRFASELREEGAWVAQIHANDRTGQAASDESALRLLAAHVLRVGRRLGYL